MGSRMAMMLVLSMGMLQRCAALMMYRVGKGQRLLSVGVGGNVTAHCAALRSSLGHDVSCPYGDVINEYRAGHDVSCPDSDVINGIQGSVSVVTLAEPGPFSVPGSRLLGPFCSLFFVLCSGLVRHQLQQRAVRKIRVEHARLRALGDAQRHRVGAFAAGC